MNMGSASAKPANNKYVRAFAWMAERARAQEDW